MGNVGKGAWLQTAMATQIETIAPMLIDDLQSSVCGARVCVKVCACVRVCVCMCEGVLSITPNCCQGDNHNMNATQQIRERTLESVVDVGDSRLS